MAEARGRAEWGRTSSLMALVANLVRDPKAKVIQPADFNPYIEKRVPVLRGKDLQILRDVFCKKGK